MSVIGIPRSNRRSPPPGRILLLSLIRHICFGFLGVLLDSVFTRRSRNIVSVSIFIAACQIKCMHTHGMSHGIESIHNHTHIQNSRLSYVYVEQQTYGSNDHTSQVDTEANEFRSAGGVRLSFYVVWRCVEVLWLILLVGGWFCLYGFCGLGISLGISSCRGIGPHSLWILRVRIPLSPRAVTSGPSALS